jgi:hypothetical protein
MKATALLSWWQFKNSLRTLLSDPRKLGPVLIFVLIVTPSIGFLLLIPTLNQSTGIKPPPVLDQPTFLAYCSLFVVIFGAWALYNGVSDASVAFPLSDVDYLFPSPISRRLVLGVRMPKLWVQILVLTAFIFVFMRMLTSMFESNLVAGFGWGFFAGLALNYAFFFTVGLNISIRLIERTRLTKTLGYLILAGLGALVAVNLILGPSGIAAIANSKLFLWAAIPANSAIATLDPSRSVFGLNPLGVLGFLFVVPTAALFVGQSNFYEQSIASSFKFAKMRAAAKTGGFAGLRAVKAESFKRKSDKTYTVPPFGQGAGALFWAHLCSAAKTPVQNFVMPLLSGIGVGSLLAIFLGDFASFGLSFAIIGPFYASLFLITAARTAGEGALRRRDLVTPLPIPCDSVVLADLGVPLLGAAILGISAGLTYAIAANVGKFHPVFREMNFYMPPWTAILVGLAVLFPIRIGPRMTIQYLMVLAYPDRADKLQVLFSGCLTNLLTVPYFLIEAIACIPAILLRSVWLGLATVIVLNALFMWLMVLMSGKAVQRSLSSGEPVHMGDLFRRAY